MGWSVLTLRDGLLVAIDHLAFGSEVEVPRLPSACSASAEAVVYEHQRSVGRRVVEERGREKE